MQKDNKPQRTLSEAIADQQRRNWLEGERDREIKSLNALAQRRHREYVLDMVWRGFRAWFLGETGIVDMEDAKLTIDCASLVERVLPTGKGENFISLDGIEIKWTFPDLAGDIAFVGNFFVQSDRSLLVSPDRNGPWLARRHGEQMYSYTIENAVIFAKGLDHEVPANDTNS